ncbi:hypothetical protein, partial [Aeromonas sp. 601019]|uniref:hypothetical protein n=1 Tax=Aeromonas sp. 601019 TaxID=2712035 RepID=UPI003BA24A38
EEYQGRCARLQRTNLASGPFIKDVLESKQKNIKAAAPGCNGLTWLQALSLRMSWIRNRRISRPLRPVATD